MFISIIGNEGYIKRLWRIFGELILFATQQWSYRSNGEELGGGMPNDSLRVFSNLLGYVGNLWLPTGGRLEGLSEASATSRIGT